MRWLKGKKSVWSTEISPRQRPLVVYFNNAFLGVDIIIAQCKMNSLAVDY